MSRLAPSFACAVALGVASGASVLPLPIVPAAIGTAALTTCFRASWGVRALAPFALGVLRAADRFDRDPSWRTPMRIEGRIEIESRLGAGLVVRADAFRVWVAEPPPGIPGPGYRCLASIRVDPVRSRADPSAFDARLWARSREIVGRGRVLGTVERVRASPGAMGAVRRALDRIRGRARQRIGNGPGAAVVVALVLGDRVGLDDEQGEAFRDAGLAHVLALSGMHAGVLAMGLGAIFASIRIRGWLAWTLTAVFLVGFALLTGARAPILRAVAGALLAGAARQIGRRSDAATSLAWIATALMFSEPLLLFDVGFRLSFAAAAVLACISQRTVLAARSTFVRGVIEALEVSAIVTLATLPELANSFGRVSLLSPLSNLMATLPATVALGWGALAAFAPVPGPVSSAWSHAACLGARTLSTIADVGARIPGGRVDMAPLPLFVVPVVIGAAFAAGSGRRPTRRTVRAALVLGLAGAFSTRPVDRLEVLDVAQGDAILWQGPRGSGMVDGGPPGWGGRASAGAAAVKLRGVHPRTLVATHGHADHYGGFLDLSMTPEEVFVSPRRDEIPAEFAAWLTSIENAGARLIRAPHPWTVRGRLSLRSPWKDGPPDGVGENDHSLSCRWIVRETIVWLLGDQEAAAEAAFLDSVGPVTPGGVLVAPHHGSRGSTSDRLLRTLRPNLVLISCGAGNPHGHPHPELLERVRRSGAAHLRTDRDGTIAITPTRNGFRLRWQRDFPGPRALMPAIPLSERPGFS